uniref:RNA-directed DNA polymerase, eukaryota n=1 Tax=Tanacetum cinerariifolium TaxID=118510 RepID=A0A699GLV7_TANCI|nr:RNA-directed DNA polymerase, eukaryota [Tanacetum cinerariifolium]
MDSIIPLGQKNTLAEYMLLFDADNRPPMLDKDLYDSWKSRMELYMKNREHGRMIFKSVENGPLIWHTVKENRVTKIKKYVELSTVEKIQADCDIKATNIILQGDDPIACLNKEMAFLTAVASSRFPSTNNLLRTPSNTRNQASIQDGRVIVQQVQGRQAWKCTQPKRPKNAAWYKDKAMLAEAREVGQIFDEEQLAFLANLGVPDGQAVQTIIPNNAAFQTDDLDTYDSNCDDISNAKAILMANILNYCSDVISEVFVFASSVILNVCLMGDRRSFNSKEDLTLKISKLVFVTNFPDRFTARDLWNVCSTYGQVVDVYIPLKKSKAGRFFAFVRFLKVDNLDRLIDNLCTICIGRFHLHANQVRFQRATRSSSVKSTNANVGSAKNSFAFVLKSINQSPILATETYPAIVLDDSCIMEKDMSCSLMGNVKDSNAISNLYAIFANEEFDQINLTYLGGLWVLIGADSIVSRDKIIKHVGVASWFHELLPASNTFVYWLHVKELDAWSPDFSNESNDFSSSDEDYEDNKVGRSCGKQGSACNLDDEEGEFVKDTKMDHVSESSCMNIKDDVYENHVTNAQNNNSRDPFRIYNILNMCKDKEVSKSVDLIFPPGFTPGNIEETVLDNHSNHANVNVPGSNEGTSSVKSGSIGISKLSLGESILEVMDNLVEVGQTIGYNMEGCLGQSAKKRWIHELNRKHKVNFVSIQETKIENINLFSINSLLGNVSYDYAFSLFVGYSGGILCVWDSNMFVKESVTIFDSFVAIRGTWISTSTKLLIISVYAPQEASERRILWDYIRIMIESWEGESIILGDFNEVRSEQERFGTSFNALGANAFNSFISMAGLVDLPLDGYKYTWLHKLTSKISKLDRFLIFEGLLLVFPFLFAICLDRHLSDHRPILLRELDVDYAIKLRLDVDKILDQGNGSDDIVNERKRSQIAIRGVLVEGDWIDEPSIDLKRSVTYDEIKCTVWDCGSNKSPGPDGFTFDFYHRYWKLIDQDVVNAVSEFFSSGLYKGIQVDESLTLSHLFYANGWVFIGKWDKSNINVIVSVLKCFFLASGIKINLHKSKLMGINIPQEDVSMAANSTGCTTLTVPFNYLGVKVGVFSSRSCSWEDVLSKITARLSKWKLKTLFIGGRLTFLKSVLTSLPLYQMSVYKVPIGVLNRMESMHRNFFNGVDNNDRKLTMIGWKKILASKKNVVLEFLVSLLYIRLSCLNWYGGILARRSPSTHIIREFHSLSSKGINLHAFVKKKVGDGEKTLFWEDSLLSDPPLKNIFPRLYTLETNKHASVAAKFRDTSMSASFRRVPRGGLEEEQFQLLVDKLLLLFFLVSKIDGFGPLILGVSSRLSRHAHILMITYCRLLGLPRDGSAGETSSHLLFSCNVARQILFKVSRWWELDILDFHSYVN